MREKGGRNRTRRNGGIGRREEQGKEMLKKREMKEKQDEISRLREKKVGQRMKQKKCRSGEMKERDKSAKSKRKKGNGRRENTRMRTEKNKKIQEE